MYVFTVNFNNALLLELVLPKAVTERDKMQMLMVLSVITFTANDYIVLEQCNHWGGASHSFKPGQFIQVAAEHKLLVRLYVLRIPCVFDDVDGRAAGGRLLAPRNIQVSLRLTTIAAQVLRVGKPWATMTFRGIEDI